MLEGWGFSPALDDIFPAFTYYILEMWEKKGAL